MSYGKKLSVGIVLILFIAYGCHVYFSKKDPSPVIDTNLGKIQGVTSVSRGGRIFYEFLGVPFAQPPVGDLRFEPPQPVKKWKDIKDASYYGAECAQLRLITGKYGGEEDCLFLNIFTPKERKGPLPVMVFLHGGAFVTGSSNGYRPSYFMDEDIILVTVNYRLAALGFINTGDGVVRGNMGLKDQTMALEWIQQNIKPFGGDPSQVTLFGESAGSASTSFHLISPMSKGLFSRAILQSGVFTSNWSVFREPAKQAKRFANKFGCNFDNTTEMVACMKKVDVKIFVQAHEELLVPLREQITIFVPTIESVKDENAFLTEEPGTILKSGRINKVPVIAGVNSEEGLLTSAIITSNHSKLEQANNEYNFWAARILNYPLEKTDVSAKIRKFYFGDLPNINSQDLIQNYTNLFSDRMFFFPLHNFAKEYPKHAPLRLYYYSHRGEFSFARILISTQKPYFPVIVNVLWDMTWRWIQINIFGIDIPHPGVCHADELPLFYDWPLSSAIKKGSKEYLLSSKLVKLWASFAQNESRLEFKNVEWKIVDPSDKSPKYLEINTTPALVDEPFAKRMNFWESLGV